MNCRLSKKRGLVLCSGRRSFPRNGVIRTSVRLSTDGQDTARAHGAESGLPGRHCASCREGIMPLRRESLTLSEDAVFAEHHADSQAHDAADTAPDDAHMAELQLPGTILEEVSI